MTVNVPVSPTTDVLAVAVRVARAKRGAVPCAVLDSDLWFDEDADATASAQRLCRACPIQNACLSAAVERREPTGVWGGEIFSDGQIIAARKPKGRPRKDADDIAAKAHRELTHRLSQTLPAPSR